MIYNKTLNTFNENYAKWDVSGGSVSSELFYLGVPTALRSVTSEGI